MQLTGKQLIGADIVAEGTTTFHGYTPHNGQPTATTFYEATDAEIDRAVALADNAFWTYRKTLDVQRAAFLEAIATEILALGIDLIDMASQESALPTARIEGERGRTVAQLRLFATFIRDETWVRPISSPLQLQKMPNGEPAMLHQRQIALGPVAVFGASNFPLAFSVAGGDTVSALAAGCPVVFKAHPAHPATCEMVGRAILNAAQQTGMPGGVFSLVHGASNRVGERLVQHPAIKAVGFTGSFRGGKALYDLAVRRPEPIPVYAEMGSTNPVFFLPGALVGQSDQLAASFAASVTQGVGQFCTNPGLFVTSDTATNFTTELARQLSAMPTGTMLTAGIQQAYSHGIMHQRSVAGTQQPTPWTGNGAQPHLLLTSVENALQHPELSEEVFGPSTVGVLAQSKEELLSFARQLTGHLTATIHGTEADLAEYADLVDILTTKVGRLVFNGFPTGVEVNHAMVHGGPFPATTDSRSTSVGTTAIYRFTRPICFQGFPGGTV
ncbi:aldehyde dehydrogenase (NADP(+)) [Fibrella sp. HMF5335]|uniref:Aldehyde dehydrogenase (NADP(+)) n=1 Tax=Fibrella rubiginis TaxID=2817060 RepID=A0A939K4H4_9BACT|nr:aldehyde dehydrogenase (NADP(+)) [Fibrella rubiginis]MBO0938424.1 aldehyde dehydrogenase (NADP(+)) [Fibrella rubiginis]